jgi:glycosyltransferase involved in cell wall biosynthesis
MSEPGLRVLHVIPAVAPRYGGPSQAIVGMARELAHTGVRVLIASTDADGQRGRLNVTMGEPVDWHGVSTIFFARQWSESWKYSRSLARWLVEHVAEFDVVHIHAVYSHACIAAATACRRRRRPYVVRPLGTLDPWSLRQKWARKRLLWHVCVKQMLKGAAAIQYTTASERDLAERPLGLRRGVVIPLGVDDALFTSACLADQFRAHHPEVKSEKYVLVLGRLHPKKGLDLLIDVFSEATQRMVNNEWKLVIAGDGEPEYVRALKQLAVARGAQHRVVFTGWIGGDEKVGAIQGAAALALPSRQENFGLVVAEALACGVPVLISTQVNLATEVDSARAGWVAPLERQALLGALADLLQSDDERVRRGANGRALACARFRWPTVASELTELYRAIAHT